MRYTLFFVFPFIIISCSDSSDHKTIKTESKNEQVETKEVIPDQEELIDLTRKVLQIIKDNNFKEFSTFVHPEKGVQFSPYAYIDTIENITLHKVDFQETNTKKILWGFYDGRGDSISLTLNEYLKKFVYDVDFINAEQTKLDTIIGSGSSLNNLKEIYPNNHFVECYFSGFNPEYDGMDWRTLRLVFEEYENKTVLIAIIHDQWTI